MRNIKTYKQFENNRWDHGYGASGILVYAKDTKKFLISLRSEYVYEPNTWNVFCGACQFSDVKKSALLELEEETGYRGKIELIEAYIFEESDFKFTNFIGIVEKEFDVVLDWVRNSN